jgi:uncharacterized protein YwqG
MDSRKIKLKPILSFDKNVAIISNYTSMPKTIEWPKNVEGKLLQCIAHIPTNIINGSLPIKLKDNYAISIFTYYDKDDYFLDKITYAGDEEDFKITQDNTRVILHEIGDDIYSLNETIIPFHEMTISDEIVETDYYGSKMGGSPTFIQNKKLQIDKYNFVFQLYGGDFPDSINDIFYLTDSLGYLFVKKDDLFTGLFFTQAG